METRIMHPQLNQSWRRRHSFCSHSFIIESNRLAPSVGGLSCFSLWCCLLLIYIHVSINGSVLTPQYQSSSSSSVLSPITWSIDSVCRRMIIIEIFPRHRSHSVVGYTGDPLQSASLIIIITCDKQSTYQVANRITVAYNHWQEKKPSFAEMCLAGIHVFLDKNYIWS